LKNNRNNAKIDRQREHQANERTFLAWLRTSIALISFDLRSPDLDYFCNSLIWLLLNKNLQDIQFLIPKVWVLL
jgi:putative membrane protein